MSSVESMSLSELRKSNGEVANQLVHSGEYHRRKARQAGKAHAIYVDSGCQFLMNFSEFKQQGKRNKLLKELGRSPIYLPGEGKPNTVH